MKWIKRVLRTITTGIGGRLRGAAVAGLAHKPPLTTIISREIAPAHLFNIPELDFSEDLFASEVGAELPGNTFHVGRTHIFTAPGGRLYSAGGDDLDVGWWRITPDGSYCRTWNVRDGRRERCYAVYRDGETFDLHLRDGWGTVSLRRTAGNPERY